MADNKQKPRQIVFVCPGHNINDLLTKEEYQQLINIIDKLLEKGIKLEIQVKEVSW